MNPSRPFILRPVATSLLMVAILLAGIIAYRVLPISALPQVDYPTIQVVTLYPGASPTSTTSSITAPLERQFGQMPGLKQMSSTSSGGASVITLQFDLNLSLDVAEQEVQAAINASGSFLADRPADAADLQQGQSGRHADHDSGADVEDDAAAEARGPRRHAARAPSCRSFPASGWSASAAASGPRCASRPIRPRSRRTDCRSTTCAPRSATPTPIRPRAASTDRRARRRSTPTISSKSADEYRSMIIAYRNGSPVRLAPTSPTSIDGAENTRLAALGEPTARDHRQHPAPARRQRDRGRRPDQAAAAAAAGVAARRRST